MPEVNSLHDEQVGKPIAEKVCLNEKSNCEYATKHVESESVLSVELADSLKSGNDVHELSNGMSIDDQTQVVRDVVNNPSGANAISKSNGEDVGKADGSLAPQRTSPVDFVNLMSDMLQTSNRVVESVNGPNIAGLICRRMCVDGKQRVAEGGDPGRLTDSSLSVKQAEDVTNNKQIGETETKHLQKVDIPIVKGEFDRKVHTDADPLEQYVCHHDESGNTAREVNPTLGKLGEDVMFEGARQTNSNDGGSISTGVKDFEIGKFKHESLASHRTLPEGNTTGPYDVIR